MCQRTEVKEGGEREESRVMRSGRQSTSTRTEEGKHP